jgi:hypothetical protein
MRQTAFAIFGFLAVLGSGSVDLPPVVVRFRAIKDVVARHILLSLIALVACSIPGCGSESELEPARLLFVGVDGASWKVIGPLMDQDELPNFKSLAVDGAYMTQFETMSSTSSPVVWTTVATGRSPQDHGIVEFTTKLPNGRVVPASSNSRRAKAIWELATEYDMTVGAVGWWATWPAERINGYVITDHANPAFSEFLFKDGRYWTADRERLTAMKMDFYPPDLAPLLAAHWFDKSHFDYTELELRSGLNRTQMRLLRAAPWNMRTKYSILKTFYAIDAPLAAAASQLMVERPAELQLVYLRGPDGIQHYAWDLVEPELYYRKPLNLERDRGIVEGVYRYVDSLLGDLLRGVDKDTWVIVASDHGAEPSREADKPGFRGRPGGHSPTARGVLFVKGPHVRKGHELDRGNPEDLMPTIAWLMGFPLSDELVGSPLLEAFEPGFVAGHPLERVASYGAREASTATASPADEVMLESLRSLGYIE